MDESINEIYEVFRMNSEQIKNIHISKINGAFTIQIDTTFYVREGLAVFELVVLLYSCVVNPAP